MLVWEQVHLKLHWMLMGQSAQKAGAASEQGEFRKWDFGGGAGLLVSSRREFGGSPSSYNKNDTEFEWNLDVGRYLTTHIKIDAGLMRSPDRWSYDYVAPFAGTYTYRNRRDQPTSFSGGVTYQFLENVFAHPYVSAGIRVTWISESVRTVTYNSTNYTSTSTTTGQRTFVQARPFVAAGYKSYFNERVYMRSEILAAAGPHGFAHSTIRTGVGIDF